MTKQEFIALVDGAPWELIQVAEQATKVTDDNDLRRSGQNLIDAEGDFVGLLEDLEIELG